MLIKYQTQKNIMQKITLNFPLVINGKEIKEIEYDPADFKTRDLLQASTSRKYSSIENPPNPINDTELHYNVAVRAVLASNKDKGWTVEDFERLAGSDPLQFSLVGMSFFGVKPEEPAQSNSEGQSESIQKGSMPGEKNS